MTFGLVAHVVIRGWIYKLVWFGGKYGPRLKRERVDAARARVC